MGTHKPPPVFHDDDGIKPIIIIGMIPWLYYALPFVIAAFEWATDVDYPEPWENYHR